MSSGLAIHEREREEERRRRAQLSRQASNSGEHPLFPEPKKVQPSVEDALQQKIQATLGKYDIIGSSLLQHGNHLLGIQRLPQTPVEGDQKFIFDPKFKDLKGCSELKKTKSALSSNQAWLKTASKLSKEVKSLKSQKVNGILNGTGHSATKSLLVTKTHDTNASSKNSTLSHLKSPTLKETTPSKSADTKRTLSHLESPAVKDPTPSKSAETKKTLSHLKSPTLKETTTPSKSTEMKKAEVPHVVNGAFKSRQSDDKETEKGAVKIKGQKEGKGHSERENGESCKEQIKVSSSNKSKPPKIKLSMPERNLPASSVEQENLPVNEPTNVEKIIAEMQQVAPPLTGIHTPIKGGNSIFAFHRNNIQDNSVLPGLPVKRKPSENTEGKKDTCNGVVLLDDDLMLTDESDDEHDDQASSLSKTTKDTRHRSHSTSSSGSSSEESDSDSSDSDSDSSASDSNNNTKDKPAKSPVHIPSSSPKHTGGRNWGLDHLFSTLNQSSTSPTTKTKPSPSAANAVGEDGVRGNQVAPAANANKSSLNSHMDNHVKSEKKSPLPMAPEETLEPFAAGLLSNSPELDHGVDIESLTAKLELPSETDVTADLAKPVINELGKNDQTVKIQVSKDNKKGKRRPSTTGSKMNSGQEKSHSEGSPKKLLKSKTETHLSKNLANVKLNNGSIDEIADKASTKNKVAAGTVAKKPTKKKPEIKSSGITVTGNEAVKPACEVDDEDVIVDIVGVETSPGHENAKADIKPFPKIKEIERTKGIKNKPAVTNGLSKHVNGDKLHVLSSLISPNRTKDILGKNVEVTYDEVNMPESLIVKIDLSLLKRIPKLPGNELIKPSASSPSSETNGSKDVITSPEVKIPKRKLPEVRPVEHETPKKVKSESDADSNRNKSRERSFSSSSTSSRHSKEGHRKRSPSQEKDSYRIKRQRHDSENNKVHDSPFKGLQNGRLNESGADTVDNGLKPHPCSCNRNSENGNKCETDISRFYDPEPRVPYGPDHYLAEAKRLKHKADSSTDKEAKAFLYVDAVLHFARCGKAIEQNEESDSRSAIQMYSETLDLLRYTMRNFVNKHTHRSDRVPDKRLSVLCMRIQSILYMRLYKLRKDNVMRNVKMVTEHFRGPPKSTQAPSPYTSNTKTTGTPSPLSPTPSPSGSVGSVGSNGSNETMTTPSRNGKPSSGSNAMTSPVNVCIPQKIHAMTQQHVLLVNNLVYSQDMWDQAQPVVLEFKDFFMDLDRKCGPLTLHSSIVHLFGYIEEGMKRIQDSLKTEKSS